DRSQPVRAGQVHHAARRLVRSRRQHLRRRMGGDRTADEAEKGVRVGSGEDGETGSTRRNRATETPARPTTGAASRLVDEKAAENTTHTSDSGCVLQRLFRPRGPLRGPVARALFSVFLCSFVPPFDKPFAQSPPLPIVDELVLANRILANENVLDGYGHVRV